MSGDAPVNGAPRDAGPVNGGDITDGPAGLDDLRQLALAIAPQLAPFPIVAFGWATVDLDAVRERIEADSAPGLFETARRDDHLGARAAVHRPGGASGEPTEVLLEPDTEGRLAASLARHGEGFTAIWFARPAGAPEELPDGFGPPGDRPLGPARLLLGGPPWGLSVLLLEADRA